MKTPATLVGKKVSALHTGLHGAAGWVAGARGPLCKDQRARQEGCQAPASLLSGWGWFGPNCSEADTVFK